MLFATLVAPHGRVVAFEPVPFLYDALARSVRENRFDAIVETHPIALSSQPGILRIRYAEDTVNLGGAFVVADDTPAPPGAVDVLAAADTLPAVLGRSQRCSFIKLDVEGAEPAVLAGADNVLMRDRPAIMCELHNAQLSKVSGATATGAIDTMAKRGYRCGLIDDGARGTELTAYERDVPLNVVFDPL